MVEVRLKKGLGRFTLDVHWKSNSLINVIFGPSGSGKSLTLKAIAGLIKPDEGYIKIGEKVFYDSSRKISLPVNERRVGYLPQNHALFPHLTVFENITFGKGIDRDWVKYLVDRAEIGELLEKYPKNLSGGESQRAALVRALAIRPRLLLLDEPLSSIHATLRARLLSMIKELCIAHGIPLIMVTHDVKEMLSLGGNCAIYLKGNVAQWGRAEKIFFFPASKKIAELLGHKNFVRVLVTEAGENRTEITIPPAHRITIPKRYTIRGKAYLLIPSAALALKKERHTIRIEVKILRVERVGDSVNILVEMGEGDVLTFSLPLSLAPNLVLEPGKRTDFLFSTRLFHLIPEEA